MSVTLEIIDSIIDQLKAKLPHLAVEYFPEKPDTYRLNHPRGALLVSYAGSNFGKIQETGYVLQPRTTTFSITVILRQLNGRGGAIDVLDQLRLSIIGFKPPNCRRKIWAINEKFLGETAGLWQYALDIATEGVLLEDADLASGVPLAAVNSEETQ